MEPDAFAAALTQAEAGDPMSQFDIGVCYLRGDGVPVDQSEARKWLFRAAERGHSRACFNLGSMFLQGWGLNQDSAEAKAWFHKAFNEHDPDLLFSIGRLVEDQHALLDDWPFAVRCYQVAADRDHTKAQVFLGMKLFLGQGIAEDREMGRCYIARAAEKGEPNALCFLARIYEEGIGHDPYPAHAAYLYRMAAFHGRDDAEQLAQTIEQQLSDAERKEVHQKVASSIAIWNSPPQ